MRYTFGFSLLVHMVAVVLFASFAVDSFRPRATDEVLFVDMSQMPIASAVMQGSRPAAPIATSLLAQHKPDSGEIRQNNQPASAKIEQASPVMPLPTVKPVSHTQNVIEKSSSLPAATSPGTATTASATATPSSKESGGTASVEMTFGAASAPSFEHRTIPVYPLMARRFGKEGTVILRLAIDEHGILGGAEVLQDPGYGFAAAALEAVKKSRFKPAQNRGKPVPAKGILPIRFALQGN